MEDSVSINSDKYNASHQPFEIEKCPRLSFAIALLCFQSKPDFKYVKESNFWRAILEVSMTEMSDSVKDDRTSINIMKKDGVCSV